MSATGRIKRLGWPCVIALAASSAVAQPTLAEESITEQQWNEFHDLLLDTLAAEELGGVTAQPAELVWQEIQPPSEEELTAAQKKQKEQLESGTLVYKVEIPESERVPGGPTHRTVTAPAPMGGTDEMVMRLAGPEGMATQIQSELMSGFSSGAALQSGPAGGAFQNSAIGAMLVDGLSGLNGLPQ